MAMVAMRGVPYQCGYTLGRFVIALRASLCNIYSTFSRSTNDGSLGNGGNAFAENGTALPTHMN